MGMAERAPDIPQPVWQHRERPTLQLYDVSGGEHSPECKVVPDAGLHDESFTDWLRIYRMPVHNTALPQASDGQQWLAERRVNLNEITEAVSTLTAAPAYPSQRVITNDFAAGSPDIANAQQQLTPGLIYSPNELIDAQYNPILGIITLNQERAGQLDRTGIADITADALGQAAIGSIVNIHIQHHPQPAFRYWYGYQWRYADNYYGGFIHKAATAHIASRVRHQLGYNAPGPADHPAMEPYRRAEGYYYEAGGAMILDMINTAAGFKKGQLGIYEPIWQFGKAGGDASAREEAQTIIDKASRATLRLETLESAPVQSTGMPVTLMRQCEERCNIPTTERITKILIARNTT